MEQWFIRLIRFANERQISKILDEAVRRYQELYPEWEIMTISIDRSGDTEKQLENIIAALRSLLAPQK